MEERFVCPFCGRDDFERKCDFSRHVNYCKMNPDRAEVSDETRKKLSEAHKGKNKGKIRSDKTKQKISEAITKYFNDSDNRQKLSEAIKKLWDNPEYRQKTSEAHKGKTISDKTRQKLSEAIKKAHENPEYRKKLSKTSKRMWENPAVRQKISEAMNRPEVRQKNSAAHKGKTLSDEHKQKIGEALKIAMNRPEVRHKKSETSKIMWENLEYINKIYETKKQNNSFNTSKIEEQLKEYFITNNINFISQYKNKEYPWMCDFYFPDKDLYVEIQGLWTHGGRPFNNEDEECIKQLEKWKSKNTKFYKNAIETWTVRDVRKRNHAKEHNLNWIEIFSTDLDECLETIMNLP